MSGMMTPARVRGLEVLLHAYPTPVAVSNETRNGVHKCVYWQTARWLVSNGYAIYATASMPFSELALTEAGLQAAGDVGLVRLV